MRRELTDVLRDLRGELNPDPATRADGDVYAPQIGRPARARGVSVAQPRHIDPEQPAYTQEVGVLPHDELRRLINKWRTRARGYTAWRGDDFTGKELASLAHVHPVEVRRIAYEMPKPVHQGKRLRLSQTMLRIEAGLITKKAGVITHHVAPQKPAAPPITRRVVFTWDGRPVLLPGDPPPAPRPFPTMMKSWILG